MLRRKDESWLKTQEEHTVVSIMCGLHDEMTFWLSCLYLAGKPLARPTSQVRSEQAQTWLKSCKAFNACKLGSPRSYLESGAVKLLEVFKFPLQQL